MLIQEMIIRSGKDGHALVGCVLCPQLQFALLTNKTGMRKAVVFMTEMMLRQLNQVSRGQ